MLLVMSQNEQGVSWALVNLSAQSKDNSRGDLQAAEGSLELGLASEMGAEPRPLDAVQRPKMLGAGHVEQRGVEQR